MSNRPKELSQILEAERMYCCERLPATIIAVKMKCNIKTIYKWRDKYKWGKNGILFTEEEIKDTLQDIANIKDDNLRISLANKFTRNKYRYFSLNDIIEIISEICLIKENNLRITLSERIKLNHKYKTK